METRAELAAAELAVVGFVDVRSSAQWARIACLLFGTAEQIVEQVDVARGARVARIARGENKCRS
jgi:hypothetical protein